MTLTEFYNKYNLHDSFIESLRYNKELQTLVLEITLSFCMQQSNKKGKPKNDVKTNARP